jgi:hypothetical protein
MNPSIVKDIEQAYNSVYYDNNNLFQDIVNYCYASNIFETLEETEYFANLIIENDLAYTFVEDVLEYCTEEQLLDESYIVEVRAGLLKTGMKIAGGLLKKVTPAVRGLPAKTLVKQGYTPGGFSATGKQLSKVNKPALATQTRSIQQARAARKPPEPQKANKYAEMLAQKKASQVAAPVSKSGLSPEGQEIQRLNKMTGGGPLGTRELPKLSPRAPKPAWSPGKVSPKPQKISEPATGGKPSRGGGLTHTVRATLSSTEKTGNMKYPGLEKYATGSGPGTGGAKTPKKSKLGPSIAAGGAIAAGVSASQDPSKENKSSIKTDVYNTMDPSGKIRSRKKVGSAKIGDTFEDAFRFYRQRGDKIFDYAGKKYTTKLASEDNEQLEVLIDTLLNEGYVDDYNRALSMINSLDESALLRLAGKALKNVIGKGGSKLTKTKLPPKVDPAFQFVKQQMIKQHGAKAVMGTPQQRYASAARQSELKKNPPSKPKLRDPFPDDVYSRSDFGIRGYRSGD